MPNFRLDPALPAANWQSGNGSGNNLYGFSVKVTSSGCTWGAWARFSFLDTAATGDDHQGGGSVGISTASPDSQSKLDVNGNARVCTLTIRGGCDLSEPFPMSSGRKFPGARWSSSTRRIPASS